MIPYSRQSIDSSDIREINKVLKSDLITQGPKVLAFENEIAKYCGSKFAIAVNSATSALHIACMSLGLEKGDIVWTSPISFVASSNCALYCGATIDFVDIDSSTLNIDPLKLEKKLIEAKKNNKLPKIIIPVHMCGLPVDLNKFSQLKKKYGFKIIEDASHALGAKYKSEKIGSCKFSDITVFSFHPVKIITTGEGGVATTNNKNLSMKMEILRTHGINKQRKYFKEKNNGEWHYEQIFLGYNYRMNEIEAVLGLSQLNKLDNFVRKRNSIAKKYNKLLSDLPIRLPLINSKDYYSSFHLYVIQLNLELIKNSHKKIFSFLRKAGIGVNLHYAPIHLQPYYRNLGFKEGNFKNSEKYAKCALSIPIHPKLKNEEINYVVNKLKRIVK